MVFRLMKSKEPTQNPMVEQIKQAVEQQPAPVQPQVQTRKVEPKEIYQVVAKLPTQEVRTGKLEDGTIVHFITIEEYLTEQANAGSE